MSTPIPVDYTEKVIVQAHKSLDDLARRMRRENLWCRIEIIIDGEDGRAITLATGINERRLARNL